MLNAINNGITKFDYDEAKKTHYYRIYKACELKEQLAHWEEILKKHTLNPALKAKAGAKGLGKTETFTSAKIASIKSSLQKEINKIDAEIAKFNKDTELEITDDDFINDVTA
jgi:hypothetical protein